MGSHKIHCTECHGKGKVYSSGYGNIACLKCSGSGILEISEEEFRQIEITKRKKEEEEQKRYLLQKEADEKYRLQKEIEDRRKAEIEYQNKLKKEREENYTTIVIVIIISNWLHN